jgi:hypothetical protein
MSSSRDEKIYYDCILCSLPFQFGPHVYNGRHIKQWDVQICDRCCSANWDGIVLETHPGLMEHLKAEGIPITLNSRGGLDIPPHKSNQDTAPARPA